jgi:hypothetical protein
MLFKVDFEKAYGKIKWPFVYQMLKLKGFPNAWGDLINLDDAINQRLIDRCKL